MTEALISLTCCTLCIAQSEAAKLLVSYLQSEPFRQRAHQTELRVLRQRRQTTTLAS